MRDPALLVHLGDEVAGGDVERDAGRDRQRVGHAPSEPVHADDAGPGPPPARTTMRSARACPGPRRQRDRRHREALRHLVQRHREEDAAGPAGPRPGSQRRSTRRRRRCGSRARPGPNAHSGVHHHVAVAPPRRSGSAARSCARRSARRNSRPGSGAARGARGSSDSGSMRRNVRGQHEARAQGRRKYLRIQLVPDVCAAMTTTAADHVAAAAAAAPSSRLQASGEWAMKGSGSVGR